VEAAQGAGVLIRLWYSRFAIRNELPDAVDEYFPVTQEPIDSVMLHEPCTGIPARDFLLKIFAAPDFF
jgi:hypothetical protein